MKTIDFYMDGEVRVRSFLKATALLILLGSTLCYDIALVIFQFFHAVGYATVGSFENGLPIVFIVYLWIKQSRQTSYLITHCVVFIVWSCIALQTLNDVYQWRFSGGWVGITCRQWIDALSYYANATKYADYSLNITIILLLSLGIYFIFYFKRVYHE